MSGSNTVSLVVNASIAAELLSPECKAPTSRMPFLVHDVPCDHGCPRACYDKVMDVFFRFYQRILAGGGAAAAGAVSGNGSNGAGGAD